MYKLHYANEVSILRDIFWGVARGGGGGGGVSLIKIALKPTETTIETV